MNNPGYASTIFKRTDVTVQEFLNKREGILDDERTDRDWSEEGNEEFGYLIRIVIYRGQNRSQRKRRFVNYWKSI
jgi:hypothetical protein